MFHMHTYKSWIGSENYIIWKQSKIMWLKLCSLGFWNICDTQKIYITKIVNVFIANRFLNHAFIMIFLCIKKLFLRIENIFIFTWLPSTDFWSLCRQCCCSLPENGWEVTVVGLFDPIISNTPRISTTLWCTVSLWFLLRLVSVVAALYLIVQTFVVV